jgi:hypothetical protein
MALPGECVSTGGSTECEECGVNLPIKVCSSTAYYIGRFCDTCGPASRESVDYYRTFEEAQAVLDNNTWRPRNTIFQG